MEKIIENIENKYKYIEKIYSGLNSTIFKTFDKSLNSIIIIKLPFNSWQEKKKKVLEKERKILEKLGEHPNIVSLKKSEPNFLIYKYFEGETLMNLVLNQNCKFSHQQKEKIIITLLKVIQYLHNKGIIHQDIHPTNIFYTNNDEIILMSFNKATDLLQENNLDVNDSLNLRENWKYLKTDPFFPKIFFHNNYITKKEIDLYMIGTLAYFLFTFKMPNQQIYKAEQFNLSENVERREFWTYFIRKAINLDQEKRFKTIQEMIDYVANIDNFTLYLLYKDQQVKVPLLDRTNIVGNTKKCGIFLNSSPQSPNLNGKVEIIFTYHDDGLEILDNSSISQLSVYNQKNKNWIRKESLKVEFSLKEKIIIGIGFIRKEPILIPLIVIELTRDD